jgi:hypothetical protein
VRVAAISARLLSDELPCSGPKPVKLGTARVFGSTPESGYSGKALAPGFTEHYEIEMLVYSKCHGTVEKTSNIGRGNGKSI